MEIDIKAVIGAQLEGCLHGSGSGRCLGRIGGNGLLHSSAYLAQPACLPFIFLCVVVAGNPPCRVVGSHAELALLFCYDKVDKVLALGKLIAEPQTVVEQTETHHQATLVAGLVQPDGHLVVVVANFRLLAPYGLPYLVKSCMVHTCHLEACAEIHHVGIITLQQQTQMAVGHHGLSLEGQVICGAALCIKAELGLQHAIGRSQCLCHRGTGHHGQEDGHQMFHLFPPIFLL